MSRRQQRKQPKPVNGVFVDPESSDYKKRNVYRLTAEQKKQLQKKHGLGALVGKPLPAFLGKLLPDWIERQRKWIFNRSVLERMIPRIFESSFFSRQPFLGGRKEGEVRRLIFPRNNPFVSFSGMRWYSVAIKKFHRHSMSGAENQARTLHSLNLIVRYFKQQNMMPKTAFEVRVAEVITFKGPFLVMRDLSGKNMVTADKLDSNLKLEVVSFLRQLSARINGASSRMVKHFEKADLVYPNTDFDLSNIICKMKNGKIEEAWIIDQFSKFQDSRFRRKSPGRISPKS